MNLSRRRLLGQLGRLALASPFVPLFRAAADPLGAFVRPRNLVVIVHPNGLEPGWKPTVEAGKLKLSPVLSSLQPFADKLLVVHGLQAGIRNEVAAHAEGMTSLLTGAQISKPDGFSAHPSVDQLIAERISQGAPLRSLELGVQSQVGFSAGNNESVMVYSQAGKVQPEDDPNAVFRRLFSGSLTPAEQTRLETEHASVLDFIRGDLGRVRSFAGSEAAAKLDAHFEGLRQLETRLHDLATLQCDSPFTPHTLSNTQLSAHEQFTPLVGMQSDLAVLALKCGVTRVVTLQLSHSTSDRRIPGVNPSVGLHTVMHSGTRADRVAINRYFAGQVAALLGKLDAVRSPDGSTLLDQTLVVWGTEMAIGNHLIDPVPFIVAGGSVDQGYFGLGKLLELSSPHRTTQLLLSVMRAFGLDGPMSLGDLTDEIGRGPLAGASRVA